MLDFYKKTISGFVALVFFVCVVGAICVNGYTVKDTVQPKTDSRYRWHINSKTDKETGGKSTLSVVESNTLIEFEYSLNDSIKYPYVFVGVDFQDKPNNIDFVDFSRYSSATFKMKCNPRNLISIHLINFDPDVSNLDDYNSYRVAEAFVSCSNEWEYNEVDLRKLIVREWWLWSKGLDVHDQRYWLNKTVAFSFVSSSFGPVSTSANVQIGELTLRGTNWRYIWVFAFIFCVSLIVYFVWLFRFYTAWVTADVKEKLQGDLPLIAYQALCVEPAKGSENSDVLHFMATQYANPQVTIDAAAEQLGISRTKINDILKDLLGLTFSTYLNKLRLSEAARLLAANSCVSVAEVAYSVGYNNVSYFNRLFKQEYGCTPKVFKKLSETASLN